MINMNKYFFLKLIIIVIALFHATTFSNLEGSSDEMVLLINDKEYHLVEENTLNMMHIKLFKDNNNCFYSQIYRENGEEITFDDLIKKEVKEDYLEKEKELLTLKYPKFVVEGLTKEDVHKTYYLNNKELVIYYDNYEIKPSLDEILYLKINYQEIRNYLTFVTLNDEEYENENGYNYTLDKKAIAITFDDSPSPNKTNLILNSLALNHFHATFFIIGEKAINNKDLLLSIKESGNEIGSHTYKHQNMQKLSKEEIEEDFIKMNNLYEQIFRENLKLIRPPYGLMKKSLPSFIDASIILWSMDTNDWRYRNSDYLVNYVIENVKDGDIILFHDAYDSTVKAIEELLPLLYSKGYQVMSVSELFKLKNIPLENSKIYTKALENS